MFTQKEIRELIEEGKEFLVPEEDLAMFYENEEARKNYSAKGIQNLYTGVCHEAVIDYKKARRYIGTHGEGSSREAEKEKAEIEKFFASDFFKNNAKCQEPEKVIKAIEDDMRKDAMRTMIR